MFTKSPLNPQLLWIRLCSNQLSLVFSNIQVTQFKEKKEITQKLRWKSHFAKVTMAASTGALSTTLPTSTILATTLSTTTSEVPALTTVLNLPSSCLADKWLDFQYISTTSNSDVAFYMYDYLHLGPLLWDSDCFPSGYSPETTDFVFYSPGLCRQSYMQACSTKLTAGTVTETQAIYCPI